MFEIRETPHTGLGWFATRDIPANTPIADETVTFRVPMSLVESSPATVEATLTAKLTAAARDDFDMLVGATATEKLWLNGFPLLADAVGFAARKEMGIFLQSARLNHSCQPNACRALENAECSTVSQRAIRKGEEITISYVDENFAPAAARGEELRQKGGSGWSDRGCCCVLCSGPAKELAASDKRRLKLLAFRKRMLGGDGSLLELKSLMDAEKLPLALMGQDALTQIVMGMGGAGGGTPGKAAPPPSAEQLFERNYLPGRKVVLHKLKAKPELNGRTGVIAASYDRKSGRVAVMLSADPAADGAAAQRISVKPENLCIQSA